MTSARRVVGVQADDIGRELWGGLGCHPKGVSKASLSLSFLFFPEQP